MVLGDRMNNVKKVCAFFGVHPVWTTDVEPKTSWSVKRGEDAADQLTSGVNI